MNRYVEYDVGGGKSVIVEVQDSTPGMVPAAAHGDLVVKSKQGFEQALETIGPIAEKLLDKLGEITRGPDEIGIEFGLKLGFQAGAIIASGSTEANFKVSLTWKRETASK